MNIHGSMCISRPAWAQQRPARGHCTKQVACRAVASGGRPTVSSPPDEVDILVVGSGVGGLSAASLLAKYDSRASLKHMGNLVPVVSHCTSLDTAIDLTSSSLSYWMSDSVRMVSPDGKMNLTRSLQH